MTTSTPTITEPYVTIYSLPDCGQCMMTEKQFAKAEVPFRVVDLEQDPEARERFKQQGILASPVVETRDGQIWGGFRPDRIKSVATQCRAQTASLATARCFSTARGTTTRPAAAPQARRAEAGQAVATGSEVAR